MEKSQIMKSASPTHSYNQQHNISKSITCDSVTKKQKSSPHQLSQQQQQQQLQDQLKIRDEDKIKNLRDAIPDVDNIFDIHNRIGSGTFSTVFLATLKGSKYDINYKNLEDKRKLFAIKHIIPTSSPHRIVKELKCLVDIGGFDNIIGIKLCLRYNENVAFVMPYLEHDRFQTYYEIMPVSEVQLYMKNLLIALRRVHKFNIIHRDVKPRNFLYNRKTKEFLLIDFGLAQTVVKRSDDQETSLLKRKIRDDQHMNSTGCCHNKRICHDKINDDQLKLLDKMPLKQINGVTSAIASTPSSSEQLIKKSKSESPNNSNTQLEKGLNDINNQKSNKKNSLYQRTPRPSHEQHLNSSSIQQQQQQQQQSQQQSKCNCFAKPQVCKTCLVKKEVPASRAGTPGYRPPEVLLKYTDQTTAVDIWAAGVIFISILSGVYPFFKAPDDFIALAEIVMLFGDEAIRKTAFTLGRQVTMSRKCKALNLRRLCVRLRNRNKIDRSQILAKYEMNGKKCEECSNCQQVFYDCLCENSKYKLEDVGEDIFPDSAYDFLLKLLEINPHKRITAAQALQHPFLREKYDLK